MRQFVQPKQHYVDLYDLFTIKECLRWYWSLRDGMEKHRDDHRNESGKDFDHEVHKVCSYTVNVIEGERYRRKNKTIQEWMDRDEETQKFYDEATPHSEVFCKECNGKTKIILKELHDRFDEERKISFMFKCLDCKKRQIFYHDGSPWDFKRDRCPDCNIELQTKHDFNKKDDIDTITDFCPDCDYKKVDVTDFKANRERRAKEKAHEEMLLREYREEFCLNDKNGPNYVSSLDRLIQFGKDMDDRKKKEADPAFKKAKKLKKLKLNQLKELVIKKIEDEKYVDLQFGKPDIGKYVIVDFTVNDSDDDRSEYDSEKQLKKLITEILKPTNWRLMSDGINYRMGILTGRLKAYESDEDLMRLVKNV